MGTLAPVLWDTSALTVEGSIVMNRHVSTVLLVILLSMAASVNVLSATWGPTAEKASVIPRPVTMEPPAFPA